MPPMLPPLAERRPDLVVAADDLRLTSAPSLRRSRPRPSSTRPASCSARPRAVEALELGLTMRAPGAHVFAAGYPGTGRGTAIAGLLARIAPALPVPPTACS